MFTTKKYLFFVAKVSHDEDLATVQEGGLRRSCFRSTHLQNFTNCVRSNPSSRQKLLLVAPNNVKKKSVDV